jgi:methylphosphotriester-DNA--protein-cysteine methyltransferase
VKRWRYTLIDANGTPYESPTPGTVGGHRATRIYGRLECPSALRAIEHGGYVTQRVFFADEATARAAGYRPCARCLPDRYRDWKNTSITAAGAGRSHCR